MLKQVRRRVTIREALDAMSLCDIRRAAVERVPIGDAAGRILARPVNAAEDVPPFSRSRVDGYAVKAADVKHATPGKPVRLELDADVLMGKATDNVLRSRHAARVPTGGMLPPGADSVVMIEDADELDGAVFVRERSHCEDNVTPAAADVRAGGRLLDAGVALLPAAVGMLAGAGVAHVDVYVPPSVALLVTGDELVEPGAALAGGEIRDINRYALGAALSAMGFSPRAYPRVPDDRARFAAAFALALGECDAVVISGGSSVGERDYAPAVVAAAGEPGVVVHGVRAKPGRPTLLGAIGDKPVIGLPGNPVSALVMLETLGKPVLWRMFQKAADTLPVPAVLAAPIDLSPELEHRVPVKLRRAGSGGVIAEPLFGTSAQMHTLGMSDALVAVPIGCGPIAAGTVVDAIPFTR